MSRFTLLLLPVLFLAGLAIVFVEGRPAKSGPTYALVVEQVGKARDGVTPLEALRITKRELLDKLEGFFPDYAALPKSDRAAGWDAGYEVFVDAGTGKSVRILVSHHCKFWSTGDGDFDVKGDFEQFVSTLRDTAE